MANGIRKLAREVRGVTSANRSDLMGDLGFTQSQMDSIFGNLLTTGKGLSRTLTKTQARELAAMKKVVTRGTAQSREGLADTRQGIQTRYGSAVAGAAADSSLLGIAKATGRATAVGGRAGLQAGKTLAKGGTTALDIQQASATEALAGAQYAMAQATAYRAKQDAALAAEMRLALAEKKYDARQAEKERTGPGGEVMVGAQENLLAMAMEPGATLEQLTAVARQMERTYNLRPGSLTDYVKSMFDAEGNSTVAAPLLDAAGNVIQTELDDEDMLRLKQDTLAWLKNHPDTTTPEASREKFLNTLTGVNEEGETTLRNGDSDPTNDPVINPQLAAAIREYAAEQYDAAAGSFYKTEAEMDASEQEAKESVALGKVSNASASFLGLDDGDVGWDTALTIGLMFVPGGALVRGAKAGVGAAVAATGVRAGIKAGVSTAARTTMSAVVRDLNQIFLRSTAKAAAKAAATRGVQGGVKGGLSASSAQFAAGRAVAPAAARASSSLPAGITGAVEANAAAAAARAATGAVRFPGASTVDDFGAALNTIRGMREVVPAVKAGVYESGKAAATARAAAFAAGKAAPFPGYTGPAVLGVSGLAGIVAANSRLDDETAARVLARSPEEVAARTANSILRSSAVKAPTPEQQEQLVVLLESLLVPKNAIAWQELLAQLA